MTTWFLDSIDITGGFLAGLSLKLPHGLICVIGPRGSGKSTLAEALRHAFGSSNSSSKALVQANLGDAIVTARTAPSDKEGVAYLVRRALRQPPVLSTLDGAPVQGIDLERGTFLPLDVYSSNEIESIAEQSLGDRRRSLLDELRSQELMQIQIALQNQRRALDANRDAIRSTRDQISSFGEQIETLADAPARLQALPPAPTDNSHGELTRATRQRQLNDREYEAVTKAKASLAASLKKIEQLLDGLEPVSELLTLTSTSRNTSLLTEARDVLRNLTQSMRSPLAEMQAAVNVAAEALDEVHSRLQRVHSDQRAEAARLEDQNLNSARAVQIRSTAERAVAQLKELHDQRAAAQEHLQILVDARRELRGVYLLERENISRLREEVAGNLQHEAGEKVRIRVLRNADNLAYQNALSTSLQGARVKNHEQILGNLLRLHPEDLAQLIHDQDFVEFETQTGLSGDRGRKIFDAFREKLDPMELELIPTEDQISIELNVGSAQEPSFKDASTLSRGQKCTALLPLLLARRETPLVVDQPEDNLDNHFIYETVVDTIRRLKGRRQMIFVTHNANIPVLAEADLVIVMDSDGRLGFVRKQGTLDSCRDEIIDLLEGGRKAFELRRQRYGSE